MNKDLYKLSYTERKNFNRKVFSVFFSVVCVFVFLNLLFALVIFPVRQSGLSMSPDIPSPSCSFCVPLLRSYSRGDVVLVKPRANEDSSAIIRAADVVVRFFTAEQFGLINYGANGHKLRRVVGLPGDTVYMRDYVLYVRPAGEEFFLTEFELSKKIYNISVSSVPATWNSDLGVSGSFEQIVLGEDEYFVLADERVASADSRLWEVVSDDEIRAKAVLLYFPLSKLRLL